MWNLFLLFQLFFYNGPGHPPAASLDRPQCYAAYKAHTIMPASLRFLVKRDAQRLFAGLRKGLSVPYASVDEAMVMAETEKITRMINAHAPFASVIQQMGYVSGLVGVYTNPSLESGPAVQRGFQYYLNTKLDRCLFVFDGHEEVLSPDDLRTMAARLHTELSQVEGLRRNYRGLLEDRYAEVKGDWRYAFNERSAVFGVSSIYFSNMARLTAHLWYYAWASAHGDLTRTPYSGMKKRPDVRKSR